MAAGAGLGAALSHFRPARAFASAPGPDPLLHQPLPPGSAEEPLFGRAIVGGLHVHPEPVVNAPDVRFLKQNEVVEILEAVEGDPWLPHNPVWFEIDGGFVHSSFVQPVRNRPQPPSPVEGEGWWGEVTIPYGIARSRPDPQAPAVYVFPYGTTYWIVEARRGSDGAIWYRVHDEQKGWAEWVPSHAILRLTRDDFAPLRPEVTDKLVEIDLTRFQVTAWEAGQPVLTAPIATGARFKVRGTLVDFRTPPGEHRVLWKRTSRHMIGGTEGESDYFDLPGVPWVTYFTWTGAAVHGTYWHNDYGRQRSHGCVNVTPEVARFFYRWTLPAALYEAAVHWAQNGEGTRVLVHY